MGGTPAQRHEGEDKEILEKRVQLYAQKKKKTHLGGLEKPETGMW